MLTEPLIQTVIEKYYFWQNESVKHTVPNGGVSLLYITASGSVQSLYDGGRVCYCEDHTVRTKLYFPHIFPKNEDSVNTAGPFMLF